MGCRWGIGQVLGAGDVPGKVLDSPVVVLGVPAQQRERLLGGELVLVHQDALGDADVVPAVDGLPQVRRPAEVGRSDRGLRGDQPDQALFPGGGGGCSIQ